MKPEKVFKRYDIRGEYPEEIDEEFAYRLGQALGTFVSDNYGGQIVVGKDNKETSKTLTQELIDGILSTGVNVFNVGTGPTDYIAFISKQNSSPGVQITSSHMPLDFNGFKFIYPEGNSFVNEDLYALQHLFREKKFKQGKGSISDISRNSHKNYREAILRFAKRFGGKWDKKIVVDTLGGSAEVFINELFEELGADVVNLGERKEYTGIYQDPPDPKPERLDDLKQMVKQEDANLGLAFDLDADRVTLYKNGFVDGNDVFALLSQLFDGEIVGSIDTSDRLQDFAEGLHYTRVGDPFVLERSLEEEVPLSGEPNGHYAFTDFVPYNSGILSGLLLAGMDLEEQIQAIPDYTEVRDDIEVNDKEKSMQKIEDKLGEHYSIVSNIDGVKIQINGVKVLVRSSGSSNLVRVLADGRDKDKVEQAAEKVSEIVRNS